MDFVDGALDPSDPEKWRAEAEANVTKNCWGSLDGLGLAARDPVVTSVLRGFQVTKSWSFMN